MTTCPRCRDYAHIERVWGDLYKCHMCGEMFKVKPETPDQLTERLAREWGDRVRKIISEFTKDE